jgi:amidase
LNVPIGPVDDLPVGMMVVGRRNEDGTVLRVASAMERAGATLVPAEEPGR